MRRRVLLRRFAIAAPLIAFFLPLSKCSQSSADGSVKVEYTYPIENVVDGVRALTTADEQDYDAIVLALLTLAVFVLPAVIAATKARTQSVIHLLLFGPAEWLLYFWTTLGDPQAGGIIAMSAWGVLLVVGAITLVRRDNT